MRSRLIVFKKFRLKIFNLGFLFACRWRRCRAWSRKSWFSSTGRRSSTARRRWPGRMWRWEGIRRYSGRSARWCLRPIYGCWMIWWDKLRDSFSWVTRLFHEKKKNFFFRIIFFFLLQISLLFCLDCDKLGILELSFHSYTFSLILSAVEINWTGLAFSSVGNCACVRF